MVGPLTVTKFPQIDISRFGVILKNNQPVSKWRMIVDLSHPKGKCANDGDLCSLHYTSVDDAVKLYSHWERGHQWRCST